MAWSRAINEVSFFQARTGVHRRRSARRVGLLASTSSVDAAQETSPRSSALRMGPCCSGYTNTGSRAGQYLMRVLVSIGARLVLTIPCGTSAVNSIRDGLVALRRSDRRSTQARHGKTLARMSGNETTRRVSGAGCIAQSSPIFRSMSITSRRSRWSTYAPTLRTLCCFARSAITSSIRGGM